MNRTVFFPNMQKGSSKQKKTSIQKSNSLYKENYVNIDSRFRNLIPKNILENEFITLPKESLSFTRNNPKLKINIPNHKFEINDRIIIQNITTLKKYFHNCLYFIKNTNFVLVNYPDHQITDQYLNNNNIFEIEISEVKSDSNNYISNVPINLLNSTFSIYLLNDDNSIGNFDEKQYFNTDILNKLNIKDINFLKKNYFFIQLPIIFNAFENYLYFNMIAIKFKNIAGVPLNYINANYPINYSQIKGYHLINDLDKDNIYIELDIIPYKDLYNYGDNKITLTKIIKTIDGYPNNNTYKISLKKTFYNVIAIEMISSEMGYLDYLINDSNNKIYWQNIDDGNYIYQVTIPPGNYDADSFLNILTQLMNNTERNISTLENKIYNIFEIDLNVNDQTITFKSFKTDILAKPFQLIEEVIINNKARIKLVLKHENNSVDIGDKITIASSKPTNGISIDILNSTHTIYQVNKADETYSILLPPLTLKTTGSTSKTTQGGDSVTIISSNIFRLLFNESDTIGNLIGFKNCGDKDSITNFSTKISNNQNYEKEGDFNLNEVGDLKIQNNYFNFTSSFLYFFMYLNNFESIISNGDLPNIFSKIQISGVPGDILYNTHINYPVFFDNPIPQLSELDIKFFYPNGNLINFMNLNHSFTLQITEFISMPESSNLNSNSINIYQENKDKPIEL